MAVSEKSIMRLELLGARLLVVDDDLCIRRLLTSLFREHGAVVEAVSDGIEGLELALKEEFSIIILDVDLPYLSGGEMASRIRRLKPSSKLLALTALTDESRLRKLYQSGFDIVLQKTISESELVEIIGKCIGTDEKFLFQEAVKKHSPIIDRSGDQLPCLSG